MSGSILAAEKDGAYIIKMVGDVRLTLCTTIDSYIEQMFAASNFSSVIIDLSEADGLDSTTLGFMAKIAIQAKRQFDYVPVVIANNSSISRILDSMGFQEVFDIRDHVISDPDELAELPQIHASEPEVCSRVIEAHKILMGLNAQNHAEFKDLVEALEAQCGK